MDVDNRVVIIGETEADIQRLGHPLSDETLAEILQRLVNYEANIIGVDKYRDASVPPGEEQLNAVLTDNPNIIWITHFGDLRDRHVPPSKILENTNRVGFNDFLPDKDGIVRRGLLFMDSGGVVLQSFALTIAMHYLAHLEIYPQPDKENPDFIRLGQTTIPPFEGDDGGYVDEDASGYQMIMDYGGFPERFPTYSISELLDSKIPANALRDKIVLIGAMSESLRDYFFTPFRQGADTEHIINGVELHGILVSQFLRLAEGKSTLIKTFNSWQENLWIWLWSIAGSLLGIFAVSVFRFLVITLFGSLLLLLGGYMAFNHNVWIPVVPSVVGWFLSF